MGKTAGKSVTHLVSVIIPTMMRDTLQRAVDSVRMQSVPHEILVRHDPDVNEYVSRLRAIKDAKGDIIAFLDDDAMFLPDTLEKIIPYFDRGFGFVQANCRVQGRDFNFFGTGVGTATFILRSAFDRISYRIDLSGEGSRDKVGRGWRLDTCLLYDFMEVFGEEKYTLANDAVVVHPENMKGFFNPDMEEKFYRNYRKYVDKYIYPIDPRLQAFVRERKLWEKMGDNIK